MLSRSLSAAKGKRLRQRHNINVRAKRSLFLKIRPAETLIYDSMVKDWLKLVMLHLTVSLLSRAWD